MMNAKFGDITFDDVADGTNNQEMVAIEHETLVESEKKTITSCFTLLGISPIKVHGKPFSSTKSLGKQKNSAMDTISEKVAKTLKLTKSDLDNTMIVGNEDATKEIHEKAAQFDHLMSLIKVKVLSCKTSRGKIQYLTLCPCEWSIDKCSEYFQVSQYLIKKSRDFTKENGVLSLPLQKKEKPVSHEMKEEIVSFYEDDEISRIMPRKKDYVSIGRNTINKKDSFLQTSRSCTLFSSRNILLGKLDFQSFAVYAPSDLFFLVHLEHILFVCALITKT